jgi:hypothetical protein
MKKTFATLIAFVIMLIAGIFFFGKFSPPVSTDRYKKIKILNEDRVVFKMDVKPAWTFPTHLSSAPTGIERWRKVILLSQTDYMKFLNNTECAALYGRTDITPEQIENQRTYVMDRFKDDSNSLSLSRIYVVLDTEGRTCRMIVPIHGPQGDYFASFEWIRGDWYLVPGATEIDWETANAKEIIRAIESAPLDAVNEKDFDSLMRRLSPTYLDQ